MKKNLNRVSLLSFLSGIIVGTTLTYLILFSRSFSLNLDALAKIAEIVTAFSVFIAAWTLVYQARKDSTDAAISQLSFIREKFMPAAVQVFSNTRKTLGVDINHQIQTLGLIPDFSLEWIRINKNVVADAQSKPFQDNPQLNAELVDAINMLETFSQELIHKKTVDHPALAAARPIFIQFVEFGAPIICTYTYLNKDVYIGIKTVYEAWRNKVDRDDLPTKIEKTRRKLKETTPLGNA